METEMSSVRDDLFNHHALPTFEMESGFLFFNFIQHLTCEGHSDRVLGRIAHWRYLPSRLT